MNTDQLTKLFQRDVVENLLVRLGQQLTERIKHILLSHDRISIESDPFNIDDLRDPKAFDQFMQDVRDQLCIRVACTGFPLSSRLKIIDPDTGRRAVFIVECAAYASASREPDKSQRT